MAFGLLPMLTVGAIEAISHHGSPDQKAAYLAKLISGEWSGTMNLTEPQAGSDVGALRTAATPIATGEHVGKYAIKGTKIYITWGDHELAGNVIHLVLARTPGAPAGTRGISLFVVPKYLVSSDGAPGWPSEFTWNLGTTNSEMPRVPAGAAGVRASTKWITFPARS